MIESALRPPEPARLRLSVRSLMVLVPIGGLFCWAIGIVFGWDRESRNLARCSANLAAIGAAMHDYHAKYGHFPPAYVADAKGTPSQSWRVLLLEFLDPALFRAYDFSQPWDSPHNRKLASRMPAVYACPSRSGPEGEIRTSYVVIVGPETAFPGTETVKISDVRDVSSGIPVILVAEVANVDVPWMEPRDLRSDEMSFAVNDPSKPGISSEDRRGAGVVFVDGQVRQLKPTVQRVLRDLISISKQIWICTG
jgi:Protein of unknown function (DUF1559)